jgi:hypothetical protein
MTRNQRTYRARALSTCIDWRNPLHSLAEARMRKALFETRRARLYPPHGPDKPLAYLDPCGAKSVSAAEERATVLRFS